MLIFEACVQSRLLFFDLTGVDVGDTIFFQIEIGDKGHPQAKNVRKLREITKQRIVLQNMQESYPVLPK